MAEYIVRTAYPSTPPTIIPIGPATATPINPPPIVPLTASSSLDFIFSIVVLMYSAIITKDENVLKAHFLNVGDGDCIIIELPDKDKELMMVDICNGNGSDTSLVNPVEYLGDNNKIFRYVQTHPDMDHMDGLYKLKEKCEIINFWDTKNKKPMPDFNGKYSKGIPEDWETYQELRRDANFLTRSTESISLNDGKFPYNLYVLNPAGFTTVVTEKRRL